MRTVIVSAFPGSGKSYLYNKYNNTPCSSSSYNTKTWKILDSDSSDYSWIKDENGNNTTERNPDFPSNYIKHIKDNIGKVDVIFVSSHKIVRKALKENNIKFFLVYPEKNMKEDFIQRYKNRGDNKSFINFISNNWENFIDEMESESDDFCLLDNLTKNCPYITLHDIDLFLDSNQMGELGF